MRVCLSVCYIVFNTFFFFVKMGICTCRSMIPTSITGITGTGSAATTEEHYVASQLSHCFFLVFFRKVRSYYKYKYLITTTSVTLTANMTPQLLLL